MTLLLTANLQLSELTYPRRFSGASAYRDAFVERWNDTVSNEDVVYILGGLGSTKDPEIVSAVHKLHGTLILTPTDDDSVDWDDYCVSVRKGPQHYQGWWFSPYPYLLSSFAAHRDQLGDTGRPLAYGGSPAAPIHTTLSGTLEVSVSLHLWTYRPVPFADLVAIHTGDYQYPEYQDVS